MSIPAFCVASRRSLRSFKSWPVTKMPGRLPGVVLTLVISGTPYAWFAVSKRARQVTPTFPHSRTRAVLSSAESGLDREARPLVMNERMVSSVFPRTTAWE